MLKLIELTQPMWLDLVAGVQLKVRPFTTALMFGVRAEFKREIEAMGEAAKEMTPEQLGALFNHVVARHAAMDWKGVGDENDEPLAFTLEGLAALMDVFGVLKSFEAKYVNPRLALDAEKNVSSPGPNGTSARVVEANTAAGAEAPAPSAPTH
jgi:hypothetical protein